MTTPAKLPSMLLEVNDDLWKVEANCGKCRIVSNEMAANIDTECKKLLALGVIEEAQDVEHFSQVHLVPKPDRTWRFTVDYKNLNKASKINAGFPVPNIREMIHHLGTRKMKYFGKLDLTAGFHQVGLDVKSRKYAAFIANRKIYQPTRVFMGLKNSPSYFQGMLATKVLRELLGDICELYIDDILIWGEDEESYLANLEKVFDRLLEFNIIVNPKKVALCLTEVEFLGYLLTPFGITMSGGNIVKAINFAKPTTVTEGRAFVGLGNYCRDFIPRYAEIVAPLIKLISETSAQFAKTATGKHSRKEKNAKLVWTPEAEQAFENVKKAISECKTLYFLQGEGKLLLFTDASDHGIGQERSDGKLYPRT
jgi:hypothetical protein